MKTKTYMITGANRGIGLEFTKTYLQQGHFVVATHRSDKGKLESLQKDFPDTLILVYVDTTDPKTIQDAFTTISSHTNKIDVLINNAGRYGDATSQKTCFDSFDVEDMLATYKTNALGPLLVTQKALPFLEKGTDKKAIHISSKVGSIEDNQGGGSYGYRASKAALNILNKNLSLELKDKGIASIVMHPGWVQTDMGGDNALITPEQSVNELTKTIENFTLENTGGFYERTGETIPW